MREFTFTQAPLGCKESSLGQSAGPALWVRSGWRSVALGLGAQRERGPSRWGKDLWSALKPLSLDRSKARQPPAIKHISPEPATPSSFRVTLGTNTGTGVGREEPTLSSPTSSMNISSQCHGEMSRWTSSGASSYLAHFPRPWQLHPQLQRAIASLLPLFPFHIVGKDLLGTGQVQC